ncbi:FimV/HubP family polar landmark protein [Colwelliaceae bacterium BS250]
MAPYKMFNTPHFTFVSILLCSLLSGVSVANAEDEVITDTITEQVATETNFVKDNKDSYGPIVKTDTLWTIAVGHRPDTSVSNYQVMMALFKLNPNAFLRNDINTLVAGQYLRIPTLEQIREVAPYAYNAVTKPTTITEEPVVVSVETTEQPNNDPKSQVTSTDVSTENVAEVTVVEQQIASSKLTVAASNTNVTSTDAANSGDVIASTANVNELDTLTNENVELKESLTAVDDQLSYLQYEVAKAAQKQSEMDSMLIEQKRLLDDSKKREQRLINQQKALTKQREGFLNNPISYWATTGVLAVLVIVLFVLVSRRKQIGVVDNVSTKSAPKKNAAAEKTPATNNSNSANNDKTVAAVNVSDDVKEPTVALIKPSIVAATTVSAPLVNTKAVSTKEHKTADQTPVIAAASDANIDADEITINTFDTVATLPENKHVENAFAKIDLSADIDFDKNETEDLSDAALLNTLVSDSPNKKQPSITDITLQASDDELDIEQIIDGMLDESTKPAKLRSTISGIEKPSLKAEPLKSSDDNATVVSANEQARATTQTARVHEINDYDDVEFDKLLEEISAQTSDIVIPSQANVVNINTPKAAVTTSQQTSTRIDDAVDFIAIDKLIEESDEIDSPKNTVVDEIYQATNIDVGLDEFPEFTSDVKHVNVDDDKHGVNAKLDLAQVYIEIGDFDNASVILKSVMKLGNSAQQQQAQTLLYSLR